MHMIIPNSAPAFPITGSRVNTPSRLRRECAGLDDTPASSLDSEKLLSHLGRKALHGSVGRNFKGAYRLFVDEETGQKRSVPTLYRFDSDILSRYEYSMLTSKQFVSVMGSDVSLKRDSGSHPENLSPYVKGVIWALVQHGIGPAWAGIKALLQRLAAVRGRLSLCADQAAAAKWWLSMPMASVSAEGPMPKALSTRRTSPLM